MNRYYQVRESKEIISLTRLRKMDNWRDELESGEVIGYSRYHPRLNNLEIVEVDIKHSHPVDGTDFMVVPLQFLLDNITENDMFEGRPRLLSYEVLECMEAIMENGTYPYYYLVGEEFTKRYNLSGDLDHNIFLSVVIYTTQIYRRMLDGEVDAKKLHDKMVERGFEKLTKEIIYSAVDTDRIFRVHLGMHNSMSEEFISKLVDGLYIRSHKDIGYMWSSTRNTRRSYEIIIGQYIKEI